jgi:hypothetical protein
MLRGPRGQLSCPLQVLLLLVPREAGEATTLLSGLFLALPRSYRLSTTGPGPGLTGKTKAPREESRERRSGASIARLEPTRARTPASARGTLTSYPDWAGH